RLSPLQKRILHRPEHVQEHGKRHHNTRNHAHLSTPSLCESALAARNHPHSALPHLPNSPAPAVRAALSRSELTTPSPPSPAETPPSAQSTPRYRSPREPALLPLCPHTSRQTSSGSTDPIRQHP